MPKLLGLRFSGVIPVSGITAIPSKITFSKKNLPATSQISVLGVRGGIYANSNITQYCTFTKESGKNSINVSSTGLVTCSSYAAEGHSAVISVVYYYPSCGIITDYVNVIVEE